MNKAVRNYAASYFLVQGLLVVGWWLMMYIWPETRQYFALEAGSETSLIAFWLGDLTFLGLGSLITAALVFLENPVRQYAAWLIAGAVAYALFYCFAFAMITDRGWLGIALMLLATVWTGVFAIGLSFSRTMFRAATASTTSWVIAKTVGQIVVVWGLILGLLPYLITLLEDKLGVPRLEFWLQGPISIALFIAVSSLGVASAVVMGRNGRGTPLPLDHATRLVIVGPYAWVRNPMAVSGILQGLCVALFYGSPLVAVYALVGSAIWQVVFRPLEEDDMRERFGMEFDDYSRNVRCWLPRATPFKPHVR